MLIFIVLCDCFLSEFKYKAQVRTVLNSFATRVLESDAKQEIASNDSDIPYASNGHTFCLLFKQYGQRLGSGDEVGRDELYLLATRLNDML